MTVVDVVVMEMMSYAFLPSFISMSATVSKLEEKCLKLFAQYVVVIETCSCHGNVHVYQVSSPCALPLRSAEVIVPEAICCGRHVIHMRTKFYLYAPFANLVVPVIIDRGPYLSKKMLLMEICH